MARVGMLIRLEEGEKRAVERAAEGAELPVSKWVRRVLVEAAGGEGMVMGPAAVRKGIGRSRGLTKETLSEAIEALVTKEPVGAFDGEAAWGRLTGGARRCSRHKCIPAARSSLCDHRCEGEWGG